MAPKGGAEFGLTTSTIRAIQSSSTEATGRAEQIADRLGQAIRLGLILDGELLPSEVELSRTLGVAPVTLREALATLRGRGLVVTRRGRAGGTHVHMPVEDDVRGAPPRLHEFSAQQLRELGDHRRAVSGLAAWLAAERALPEEIDDLRSQVDRLRAASTPADRRRADAKLSLEIAAAAQSTRLAHQEQQFRVEIGDLLWQPLTDEELEECLIMRATLIEAIAAGHATLSRDLAERNVADDTSRLLRLRISLYTDGAIR